MAERVAQLQLRSKNKEEDTVRGYLSSLRKFREWLVASPRFGHLIDKSKDPKEEILDTFILPLPEDAVLQFMSAKTTIIKKSVETKASFSHVNSYRNAIMYMLKQRKQNGPFEFQLGLSELLGGYKREVAKAKLDGEMPLTEGKAPMPKQLYEQVAKSSMCCTADFLASISYHLFLTLLWNMIARNTLFPVTKKRKTTTTATTSVDDNSDSDG